MFQAELLNILDDFGVKAKADYYRLPPGQKTYFIRRLYKAFVANREAAVRDLATVGGVKFHFLTSGDLTSATPNVPSATFLKKLCFYSNRVLITFPFKELTGPEQARAMRGVHAKAWRKSTKREHAPLLFGNVVSSRTPVGGSVGLVGGNGYAIDRAAFDDLLEILTSLRPAIDAGLTYVLPAFPDQKAEMRRLAPKLTAANFSLPELKRQFFEEDIHERGTDLRLNGELLNLYLPHFTDVPIERILEIRERQIDMHNEFQRYLQNLLEGLGPEEAEAKLLSVLKDIDRGIRELERSFTSLKKDFARKDVYMGVGFVCTSLALVAGLQWSTEIAQLLAGATGSATGLQFLTNSSDKRKELGSLADSEFYLPWLLHRELTGLSTKL